MMNEADSTKLFNEISQSVHDGDAVKLDEIMGREAPNPDEEQEQIEQPEVVDPPVEDDPQDDAQEEENTPLDDESAEEADGNEVDDKDESDEVVKIREQLEQLKKENHNLKSQAGRMPHVQKRLREMDKKLEELTKAKDSPSSQTPKQLDPNVESALKKIRDDDPELADAIKNAIAEALNGVDKASTAREIESLKFLRAQEAATYEQNEIDRLLTMHPNAKEVFESKHWSDWMGKQSAGVKALAESNSADDVSTAFRLYAQDMQRLYPDLVKAEASPTDDEAAKKAALIEQNRIRQKSTAADKANPGGAQKKGPLDPQSLFDKYVKDIEKEMGL